MKKKIVTALTGLAVVASLAGCGVANTASHSTSPAKNTTTTSTAPAGNTTNTTAPSNNTTSTSVATTAPANAKTVTISPKDLGMTAVSASNAQKIFGQQVTNANGKMVAIPTNKPIVFIAPWCKYCHQALLTLQKQNLLNKVTLVAVAFDGAEKGQTVPTIKNISDAKSYLSKQLKAAGITKVDVNKVLYDLPPKDTITRNLQGFPSTFVKSKGSWYVMPGLVSDSGWWTTLLNPTVSATPKGSQSAPMQPAKGSPSTSSSTSSGK